jgi:hypothetical protein
MAAIITSVCAAWAQSSELNAAFKRNQTLNKQGKYAEAIPFAQTFIALAKKEFGETIGIMQQALTTWPGFTQPRAGTPTPNRSTGAPWRWTGKRTSSSGKRVRRAGTFYDVDVDVDLDRGTILEEAGVKLLALYSH